MTQASQILSLSWSRFTRRYWGNHSYFLFLRLLICLNSAGSLVWSEVKKRNWITHRERLVRTACSSKHRALEGQKQVEPSKQVRKQVQARFRHIERQATDRQPRELPTHTEVCWFLNDAQTGMLPGYPESAICVQRFDDSLNSAIHTTYRNWLRSSSMHEPRDPPLEVVTF